MYKRKPGKRFVIEGLKMNRGQNKNVLLYVEEKS